MADPKPPRSGVGPIVREIAELEKKIDTLLSPSGTQRYGAVKNLQSAISLLLSQVEFLQTQIQAVDSDGAITHIIPAPQNLLYAFDPAFDLELTVLAGESGVLVATPCGYLSVRDAVRAFIRIDVDGVLQSAESSLTLESVDGAGATVSCSRTSSIDVTPNTEHVIRTRRQVFSSGPGEVTFSNMSLSITRLG